MTTFEDLGIAEAFGDLGEEGDDARSPSRTVGAVAIGVALALVAGGLGWWWTQRDAAPAAAASVSVETLVPALTAEQAADDRIAAADLESIPVDAATTRLLAVTEAGKHYAAVGRDGRLCVVTVPEGELATRVCGAPSASLELVVQDTDGVDVLVLTDEAAPSADDGWLEAAPNVFVRD